MRYIANSSKIMLALHGAMLLKKKKTIRNYINYISLNSKIRGIIPFKTVKRQNAKTVDVYDLRKMMSGAYGPFVVTLIQYGNQVLSLK